jgi:hypothetical protein
MTGFERGFGPADLPLSSEVSATELATSLRIGRELHSFAASDRMEPGAGFAARVMGAIAAEPVPQPIAVVGEALRRARPLAVLAGLRDAWRVAISGGRPPGVRAQALALVLVAAFGFASLGGILAIGASALLNRSETPEPIPTLPSPIPSPLPSPTPTSAPTATPSPTPSATSSPDGTPRQTTTPNPAQTAEPTDTAEPDETDDPKTPRPSDDNSGPGGGGGGGGGGDG